MEIRVGVVGFDLDGATSRERTKGEETESERERQPQNPRVGPFFPEKRDRVELPKII